MKILISNDDGVTASGILSAKKAVEDLGDVTVVAPDRQQSAVGHALTLTEPLRINKTKLRDNSYGYGVSGTPTDAVTVGLFHILDEKPDLVISGINTGFNIGKGELTTSGTLGAAFESASFSIPTIAVSQAVSNENTKFENGEVNIDFSFAEKQLNRIAKTVLKKGLPEGVDLINVNIPANPSDDEIEIVRLCDRMYNPFVEERKDLRGVPYYWIEGNLCKYEELDTDGYVLNIKQRTTITPLIIDLTTDLDKIKKWFI